MPLTTDDRLDLQNLMGHYCQLMDEGDPRWADLFTHDGVLSGIFPEPVIGMDALRAVPAASMEQTKGFFRHHLGSVTIDPEGEGARVKGYNLVTDWSDGGKLILLARYSILAVRTGAGWRLSRVDVKVDH
jgi:hypothetical protein